MTKVLHDIGFLYPKEPNMDCLLQARPEEPFSVNALDYLQALSQILNRYEGIKNYPDVATFAFFCRRSNLIQLKKRYYPGNTFRSGRGLLFHITPSNVPVTFAYSLVCGILSGNVNILKVSSRSSVQADIICHAITELSKEKKFQALSSRIAIVCYDVTSPATAYLSSICDARVIWGGNATIEEIRKNRLPAHAFEVTFASRETLCAINADQFVMEKSPEQVASGFYNDTYLFDQKSCTSPHLIIWLGTVENVETAKRIFWNKLHDLVKARYILLPHAAVEKLAAFYTQSTYSESVIKVEMPDNLIWRTELKTLTKEMEICRCTGGYFTEYHASSFSELSEIVSCKYQTLSYYGIENEELMKVISKRGPHGIDTIVPIGRTLDFSLTRDGYNLIDALSREIAIA